MMRLGIDASTQLDLDEGHPIYTYHGEKIEPWSFLRDHNGVALMRLRIWNDPYDENGRPYGGGTNSVARFLVLAKRALALGYSLLLDFHYSDFWADPGKQNPPKAWRNLSLEETVKALYEYTRKTLLEIKAAGIPLEAVQVGNEITNGMVWPHGRLLGGEDGSPRKGYDGLAAMLKVGCQAVREIYPESKIVLHLEKACAKAIHEEWVREITSRGVDFDLIGLSYYPFWHGSPVELEENIRNLQAKFHKPIWVVEAGHPFTDEPYDPEEAKKLFISNTEAVKEYAGNTVIPSPFAYTKQGQRDYFAFLIRLLKRLDVEALFYWEPFWVPSSHLGWAKVPGMIYEGQEVTREDLNEWANQCLFDYQGEAAPALDVFTAEFVANS